MNTPLSAAERAELELLETALLGARFAQLGVALCLGFGVLAVGLGFVVLLGPSAVIPFLLQTPALLVLIVSTAFAFQARASPDALVRSLRVQAAWWWLVMLTGSMLGLAICGMLVSVFAVF